MGRKLNIKNKKVDMRSIILSVLASMTIMGA